MHCQPPHALSPGDEVASELRSRKECEGQVTLGGGNMHSKVMIAVF